MTIENKVKESFNECCQLINERGKVYGSIELTYRIIAELWSIRAGVEIKPSDVCDMIEDIKWVRSKATPGHHDSGVDGVNYKAFAYALREQGT
jgi:hypothetical protein